MAISCTLIRCPAMRGLPPQKPGVISICSWIIPFPQKYATMIREFKDGYMKVNYQEKIDATASELKIILSEQRTITRSPKNSNTLLVKVGI